MNSLFSPDSLRVASLQTFTYDLSASKDTNLMAGPITDTQSIESIQQSVRYPCEHYRMKSDHGILFDFQLTGTIPSGTSFELVSASLENAPSGRIRQRRQATHKHRLVLIIRFIFQFSKCNAACQQASITLLISKIELAKPSHVVIAGITFTLTPPNISE